MTEAAESTARKLAGRFSRGMAAALRKKLPDELLQRVQEASRPPVARATSATVGELDRLMVDNYQVKNLVGISKDEFRRRIDGFLDMEDSEIEGFAVADQQRRYAIKFHCTESLRFLKDSFAISGLDVRNLSLYDLRGPEWVDMMRAGLSVRDIT